MRWLAGDAAIARQAERIALRLYSHTFRGHGLRLEAHGNASRHDHGPAVVARPPPVEPPAAAPGPTPTPVILASALAEEFIAAAEDGWARNRSGRRYRPSALRDLRGILRHHVAHELGQTAAARRAPAAHPGAARPARRRAALGEPDPLGDQRDPGAVRLRDRAGLRRSSARPTGSDPAPEETARTLKTTEAGWEWTTGRGGAAGDAGRDRRPRRPRATTTSRSRCCRSGSCRSCSGSWSSCSSCSRSSPSQGPIGGA